MWSSIPALYGGRIYGTDLIPDEEGVLLVPVTALCVCVCVFKGVWIW